MLCLANSCLSDKFINFILISFYLFIKIKVINKFWKIVYIVLVVHFSKFFKNYKLINGAVNLFATHYFKIDQFLTILFHYFNESFQIIICLRDYIFIQPFFLLSNSQCVMNTFMHRFSFLIRYISIKFQILIVRDKFLSIFRGFKISLC